MLDALDEAPLHPNVVARQKAIASVISAPSHYQSYKDAEAELARAKVKFAIKPKPRPVVPPPYIPQSLKSAFGERDPHLLSPDGQWSKLSASSTTTANISYGRPGSFGPQPVSQHLSSPSFSFNRNGLAAKAQSAPPLGVSTDALLTPPPNSYTLPDTFGKQNISTKHSYAGVIWSREDRFYRDVRGTACPPPLNHRRLRRHPSQRRLHRRRAIAARPRPRRRGRAPLRPAARAFSRSSACDRPRPLRPPRDALPHHARTGHVF
jgi:hypothetical protein